MRSCTIGNKCRKKAREEVESNQSITASMTLKSFQYLDWCMRESARIMKPESLIFRYCVQDTKYILAPWKTNDWFENFVIPKGCFVAVRPINDVGNPPEFLLLGTEWSFTFPKPRKIRAIKMASTWTSILQTNFWPWIPQMYGNSTYLIY